MLYTAKVSFKNAKAEIFVTSRSQVKLKKLKKKKKKYSLPSLPVPLPRESMLFSHSRMFSAG